MNKRPWTKKEEALLYDLTIGNQQLAEALHRTPASVSARRNKLGIKGYKSTYARAWKPDSICWDCGRGVTECCWMQYGSPVPGWEADRTVTRLTTPSGVQFTKGYRVTDCPLYRKVEQKKKSKK